MFFRYEEDCILNSASDIKYLGDWLHCRFFTAINIFQKEDMEFLTFFVWLHYVTTGLGMVLNTILLFLIVFKTPRYIKIYSLFILNFALTDFGVCLADMFTQPRYAYLTLCLPVRLVTISHSHDLLTYSESYLAAIPSPIFHRDLVNTSVISLVI